MADRLARAVRRLLPMLGPVVLAALLLALAPRAWAVEPMPLVGQADYLVDAGGRLSPEQARKAGDWRRLGPRQEFAAAPAAVWLRFTLPSALGPRVVLDLPRTVVSEATLFQPLEGGGWSRLEAGDRILPSLWPISAPELAFPVRALAGAQPTEVLLRLRHADPFLPRPLLWPEEGYDTHRAIEHLWIGLFLGVALMAVAYASGEALFRGDAVSAWYAWHVVLMAVFQLVQMGYARVYLGGHEAGATQAARLVSGTLLASVSLLFVRRALPQAISGLRASTWALAVAVFGVTLTAAYVLWPQLSQEPRVLTAQHGYYALVIFSVGLLLWTVRGLRLPYMRWYVGAFAAAAVGVATQIAYAQGWLPADSPARYAMLAGVAAEIAVLTYALNFSAREVLSDPGLKREGARRDRRSGLLHAAELPSLLMAMAVRALRLNTKGSVVLLRLANLDDLRRAHGPGLSEAVAKACGRVMREACNPGDLPLRLDDDRYAVLVEQVHSRGEAHAVAERILELGLRHHPELPPLEQLHWHAAIAHLPRHLKGDPKTVVERLDQLLGQIRRGSAALVRELP
ncbi:diguanylate cyclase [Aquabacterium sp. A7-Y]|uniref:sensor domain-containing diguanylate cyclase n=1 Tax=Aquabacterium sp. A7-Y TaxID=1349605 RepID=UPI00223CD393|nr:7TM diverse intracellular signaling domain-containing protein [Aquabacterium sp. A7-Y]MCW7537147.1 diguanylate cyclase [Aquabacterium sp. A7-Y]